MQLADIVKGFLTMRVEMRRWWIVKIAILGVIGFSALVTLISGFGDIFGISRMAGFMMLIMSCAINFCLNILA